MRAGRIIRVNACAVFLVIGTTSAAFTADRQHSGPLLLNNAQLDRVTAGTMTLTASTVSAAVGTSIAFAETGTGGASGQTSVPGGGAIESGAIVGMASAFSPGGTATAGASTAGTVSSPTSVVISFTGGVTFPGGQTSISATFVSGGPTFLP